MKLLLLTYEYPPFRGGVAAYLSNLMKRAPAGVEVVVDVPRQGEHWTQTIWRLCLKPRREKPDLIAVSHVLPAGYIAWNAKFWYKTPYLVFTHGTDILNARKSSWKHFWMRFILQRAKFVIANSRFTAALLHEEGIIKIEIIPPGIDEKYYRHREAEGRGDLEIASSATPPRNRNVIISIGRLVPRKGFDTLIKSMPLILKEIPDAHLRIIGHGQYYDELDRLAHELRVEKFVEILTEVDDRAKQEYLRSSALFALAARKDGDDIEGFGIVTLEAAAAGLPVVVTSSGGSAEPVVNGVTGVVVPSDDIETLSSAIIRMLQNKDAAAQMGKAGWEYVAREYSVEAAGKHFWNLV